MNGNGRWKCNQMLSKLVRCTIRWSRSSTPIRYASPANTYERRPTNDEMVNVYDGGRCMFDGDDVQNELGNVDRSIIARFNIIPANRFKFILDSNSAYVMLLIHACSEYVDSSIDSTAHSAWLCLPRLIPSTAVHCVRAIGTGDEQWKRKNDVTIEWNPVRCASTSICGKQVNQVWIYRANGRFDWCILPCNTHPHNS